MATFDTPISSWTATDVAHFARRAGFGLSPEACAAAAAQSPGAFIDAWVDGTGADFTALNAALAADADVVDQAQVDAAPGVPGAVNAPAVPAPHPFLIFGSEAWRDDLRSAQAYWMWRMHYTPYPFQERAALFWHMLFATGEGKVDNVILMLRQIQLFRDQGLGTFPDLLAAVSKDPAMLLWLDSVQNAATGNSVPNENYAREVMELYSLGVDNGYNQTDITQLARAFSGWSFTVKGSDIVVNPTNPTNRKIKDATFRLYDGSANPDGYLWYLAQRSSTWNMHGTGTISFLGQSFNIGTAPAGMTPGEDVLRSIPVSRATQCSTFLAQRLLLHFVTPKASASAITDLAADIRALGFDLRAVFKKLFKSQYFFGAANRFALVENPIAWSVRRSRVPSKDFGGARAGSPPACPPWRLALRTGTLAQVGLDLLNPRGPNGWKEHTAWLNSNTSRYRGKWAAALAFQESATTAGKAYILFPTAMADWFPSAPASAMDVYDRLVALLQPAAVPGPIRDAWLSALWPSGFTWDATAATERKVRELAFLILCAPSAQLC